MKKIWVLGLVLLCFLLAGCDSIKQEQEYETKLSNYEMVIDVDNENKMLKISEILNYVNNSDVVFRELQFHLYPNAFKQRDSKQSPVSAYNFEKAYINGFDSGYININKVHINNIESEYSITGDCENILVVPLIQELYPSDNVQLNFEFEVKVPNVIHRFGYGNDTINISNFYPIACVYENGEFASDGYHYNGDPFYSEVANYFVTVNYDKDMIIGTTGESSTSVIGESKQTICKANNVRDFAFCLSEKFKIETCDLNDINLIYLYYDDENARSSMQTIKDAVQTFENLIGEYPYKSLTVVQSNFLHGGMEFPNMVLISDKIKEEKEKNYVIVHEIAHQWFYGIIGNDEYNEAWLDEGLTEYFTVVFFEQNSNYKVSYEEKIGEALSSYQLFIDVYNEVFGEVCTSMTRNLSEYVSESEYTYCVYVKSVLMFDNLRDYMGVKNFYKGIKNYYNDNKFKIAKKDNLISALQKESKKDIEKIISPWLDGSKIL